ncbi:MAG: substrate-binding domain-containing protein [Spirochaetes bacterium]|nr:substrate-binding domain-containing protein [Spirochaetota bacterium]
MRYKIAALSSSFNYPHHPLLFKGVAKAARELNVDIIGITCGSLNTPEKEIRMRNILYNFINPKLFDGFIIPYSSLGQYAGYNKFREFLKPIFQKPCVLIGADEPDFICINSDHISGFYRLTYHLIDVHKCNAIAFLRGPKSHIVSNYREKGIRKAFKELKTDEKNLFIYARDTNVQEARRFADEIIKSKLYKKFRFAILCSGDGTALEVMQRLQECGLVIPNDIIICGSSGSPEGLFSKPSLTTIEQNVEELGYKALDILIKQIESGYEPKTFFYGALNSYRESCGCGLNHKGKKNSFGQKINNELPAEQNNLSAYLHFFRQFGFKVITDFNLTELFSMLKIRLGIKHCYLSIYHSGAAEYEYSEMLQAQKNGRLLLVGKDNAMFKTTELIPENMLPEERYTLIVEPLFYQDEQLGFITMDYIDHNGLIYEAIAAQIAGAIKNKLQRDRLYIANRELKELSVELEYSQREIVYRLSEIAETRSKETGNHVKRVAEYSRLIAEKYGLSGKELEIIELASPMHDIGKMGISDDILNKTDRLTSEEFEIIKSHTTIGYNILKNSGREVLTSAALIAHQHHERFDGSGYPYGLKGEQIHVYGRIVAIVDVFDALACDRCYKKAWKIDDIVHFFENERGRQFDPVMTDILLDNIEEFRKILSMHKDTF